MLFSAPIVFVSFLVAIFGTLAGAKEISQPAFMAMWVIGVGVVIGGVAGGIAFLFLRQLRTRFMAASVVLAMLTGSLIYLNVETTEFLEFILEPVFGGSIPEFENEDGERLRIM